MKLKFIGTGSGLASLKRFHSSILLSSSGQKLLVDAGDGISKALLNAGEDFNKIDSIIISHYHPDHFSGIATLLVQMKILERTKPLKIFTHTKLIDDLKSFVFACNIFFETFNFKVDIVGFEFDKELQIGDSIICLPKQNSHITNKHNLKIDFPFISSSFLFTIGNQNIVYTADIGSSKDLMLFKEFSIDYFIVDSTHVELDEIGNAVEKMNVQNVIFTHINDEDENDIVNWVKKQNINRNIFQISKDGLEI